MPITPLLLAANATHVGLLGSAYSPLALSSNRFDPRDAAVFEVESES